MSEIRYAYVSRRAADLSDAQIVDEIALPSLARNREDDITGALWFGPHLFFQVLEGAEKPVRGLIDRIAGDPRHADVNPVLDEPIDARLFDRWSLKVVRDEECERITALIDAYAYGNRADAMLLEPKRTGPVSGLTDVVRRVINLLQGHQTV